MSPPQEIPISRTSGNKFVLNQLEKDAFISAVWSYYEQHARILPWREPEKTGVFDPYKILVSEIMLQQTQVDRVQEKYRIFLDKFPDIESLSGATFEDVLRIWSGLGYNRRAKYLHEFAINQAGREFPRNLNELIKYKGIGTNTAAAVLVYGFNVPITFVETNIRTVYLHSFLSNKEKVSDKEIIELVEQTLDTANPREWFWALMDYGSYLKKNGIKNTKNSKHYKKQSKFKGSSRQLRGVILRFLLENGQCSVATLQEHVQDSRLLDVLSTLENDRLIERKNDTIYLT